MNALTDRVFAGLADAAVSGRPYEPDTRWTCGKCYGDDGIQVRVVDSGNSRELNRFRFVMTCRCCSQPATCPHDWPYHGEIRLKATAGSAAPGAVPDSVGAAGRLPTSIRAAGESAGLAARTGVGRQAGQAEGRPGKAARAAS